MSAISKVEASIDRICTELKLTSFVRDRCIEMSRKMAQNEGEGGANSLGADAAASAIVSIAHEEARRNGRVQRHLPNRIIGKAVGMDGGSVTHSVHLFNSRKH